MNCIVLFPTLCKNCISLGSQGVCFSAEIFSVCSASSQRSVSGAFESPEVGGSLTGNKSCERNSAGESLSQSHMPGKCMCHIHEMASGAAAETRHQALKVTEALLHTRLAVTLPPPPPVCHTPSPLSSCLAPGRQRAEAVCSAATQGAMLWSETVKMRVVLTAEVSGYSRKLKGQLGVEHQRHDRVFIQALSFNCASRPSFMLISEWYLRLPIYS